jgi:putative membrane protein
MTGQDLVDQLAASNVYAIETSKLALSKSRSAFIKSFAKRMIDALTKSSAKLKAAAMSAAPALIPDPALTPGQRAKLNVMTTLTGPAFDRVYAHEQVVMHQVALAAVQSYAKSGDVAALRAAAADLVAPTTAHLALARGLEP